MIIANHKEFFDALIERFPSIPGEEHSRYYPGDYVVDGVGTFGVKVATRKDNRYLLVEANLEQDVIDGMLERFESDRVKPPETLGADLDP